LHFSAVVHEQRTCACLCIFSLCSFLSIRPFSLLFYAPPTTTTTTTTHTHTHSHSHTHTRARRYASSDIGLIHMVGLDLTKGTLDPVRRNNQRVEWKCAWARVIATACVNVYACTYVDPSPCVCVLTLPLSCVFSATLTSRSKKRG
jgi:hypothetical protein